MSYKIDLDNIVNRKNDRDNFSTQLMRIVFKADWRNRNKLAREYPNLVKTVTQFQNTGEILDLSSD